MGTMSPRRASHGGWDDEGAKQGEKLGGQKGCEEGKEILLLGEMEKSSKDRRKKDRNRWKMGNKEEGRESSKERKSQAEQGKSDVYLSQQTKTREGTEGVI